MRNPQSGRHRKIWPSREVNCSGVRLRKQIREKRTPLVRLMVKKIEMKSVEFWL
jgi:hypothetical protein